MEVVCKQTREGVAQAAASRIAAVVASKPRAVLGLATGSSPSLIYAELASWVATGRLDMAEVSAFALSEYVGLPPGHPRSYAYEIGQVVTKALGLDPVHVHVPDGFAVNVENAAERYEQNLAAAGGIDTQLLGIGTNGHIGFNEPTSSLASRTRIKTLSPTTRSDNARFFTAPEEVPTHCITQGIGTILEARQLLLVAQGSSKSAAVAAAVEGPVSSMCPASALQLHPHATVIIDEAAAAELTLLDYYRHVYDNKPS